MRAVAKCKEFTVYLSNSLSLSFYLYIVTPKSAFTAVIESPRYAIFVANNAARGGNRNFM